MKGKPSFEYTLNEKEDVDNAHNELEMIQDYLIAKGIHVSQAEIVLAAIHIAKRLGAGNWTFVCELGGGK